MTPAPEQDVAALVAKLREGLGGVTPGPWKADRLEDGCKPIDAKTWWSFASVIIEMEDGLAMRNSAEGNANAAHIANCSPENIASILDALLASEARATALEAERDEARELIAAMQENDGEIAEAVARAGIVPGTWIVHALDAVVERSDGWAERAAALEAQLARAREDAMVDVIEEARRLQPHYQSGTATDAGRRQMLDHFEKFALRALPAPADGRGDLLKMIETLPDDFVDDGNCCAGKLSAPPVGSLASLADAKSKDPAAEAGTET